MATIGQVGNSEHGTMNLGKAGRSRWLGIRPTVRGAVMNPRDHPHGGGEGKAPAGGQATDQVGQVGDGQEDPSQQGDGPVHRSQARKQVAHEPINKEGAVHRPQAVQEDRRAESPMGRRKVIKTWRSPRLVDLRQRWSGNFTLGVHDGRPARPDRTTENMVGRRKTRTAVCADANVPGPHRTRREVEHGAR